MSAKTIYLMADGKPEIRSQVGDLTFDSMTTEQLDSMLQTGICQARAGIGLDVEDAFKIIREAI